MEEQRHTRRRAVLGVGLVLAGSAIFMRAAAQAKISKAQAKYQDKPKDGQRCDGCVHFVTPDGCKLVEGKVSPSGWCTLYAAKPK
jgi:hypothetical protein